MIELTIKHGLQSAHRTYATSPTVSEIKNDRSLRAELGYGDNVKVLVNGVEQPDHAFCPGPIIKVETAANEKNTCQ